MTLQLIKEEFAKRKKPNTKAHEHTRRDLVHREEANGSGSVWSTIVRSVFGVEGNFGSLSTQHIQPSFGLTWTWTECMR